MLQVLNEAALSKNRERYALAYGGLGSLALRIGDLPGAIDYFGRAFALYDSLGQAVGAKIARRRGKMAFSLPQISRAST